MTVTTEPDALAELIERLKKATGPDRELDAEIWRSAKGAEVWNYHDNSHIDSQIRCGAWTGTRESHPDFEPGLDNVVTWRYRIDRNGDFDYGELPSPTASIDAALTLVPEGWECILYTENNTAELYNTNPPRKFGIKARAQGTAPAIALCIAALKARERR